MSSADQKVRTRRKYVVNMEFEEIIPGAVDVSAFAIPNWVLDPTDEKDNIYTLPTAASLKQAYPIGNYPSMNMMPVWKIFCINNGSVPAYIRGSGDEGQIMIVANNTYTPGGSFLLYWNTLQTAYCIVTCPHDSDMSLSLRLSALEGALRELKEEVATLRSAKKTELRKVIKQETPNSSDVDEPLDFAIVDRYEPATAQSADDKF